MNQRRAMKFNLSKASDVEEIDFWYENSEASFFDKKVFAEFQSDATLETRTDVAPILANHGRVVAVLPGPEPKSSPAPSPPPAPEASLFRKYVWGITGVAGIVLMAYVIGRYSYEGGDKSERAMDTVLKWLDKMYAAAEKSARIWSAGHEVLD